MRSVFILTYGWKDSEGPELRETHPSIDSAQKSGDEFIAREKRFAEIGYGAPAFYRIDRYNFDVMCVEHVCK